MHTNFDVNCCVGLQAIKLSELFSGEVHGPAPNQAGEQIVPASTEAAYHGPDQAVHQRGRHGRRVLQGGAFPSTGLLYTKNSTIR